MHSGIHTTHLKGRYPEPDRVGSRLRGPVGPGWRRLPVTIYRHQEKDLEWDTRGDGYRKSSVSGLFTRRGRTFMTLLVG